MPATFEKVTKEELYQAISPGVIFADLKPEKLNGKFVCLCPKCSKRNFTVEQGVKGKGKCTACGYAISYWDHIKQKEGIDNKAVFKRLVEISKAPVNAEPEPELAGPAVQCEVKPVPHKGEASSNIAIYSQFLRVGTQCLISATDYALNARNMLQKNGFNMSEYKSLDFCLHPGNEYLRTHFVKLHVPGKALNESNLLTEPDIRGTVMIPIKEGGQIIDFVLLSSTGRDGETNLNNDAGCGNVFCKDMAAEGIKNTETAIVAGSALDVCYLFVQGFTNVVALSGGTISQEQIAWLQESGAKDVVLCKSASFESTKESIINLHAKGLFVNKITLPGKAQSAIAYMHSNGKDAFDKLLRKAMTGWAWIAQGIVDNIRESHHGIGDNALREKAIVKSAAIVDIIHDTTYLTDFLKQLAVEVGVKDKDLKARLLPDKQKVGAPGIDTESRITSPPASIAGSSNVTQTSTKEADAEIKKRAQEMIKHMEIGKLNDFIKEFVIQMEDLLEIPDFLKIENLAKRVFYKYPYPSGPEGENFKRFLYDLKPKALKHEYDEIKRMLDLQKVKLSRQ